MFTGSKQGMPHNLHDSNRELLNCIEDLHKKSNELHTAIAQEEQDKAIILSEISVLNSRLKTLNESLDCKKRMRTEYEKTLKETEGAYKKILESTQTLLHVLKREKSQLAPDSSVDLLQAKPESAEQASRGSISNTFFSNKK